MMTSELKWPATSPASAGSATFPTKPKVVNIEVETEADELNRQRFWCYWIAQGKGKGQIFFDDLTDNIRRWRQCGYEVNVKWPNEKADR